MKLEKTTRRSAILALGLALATSAVRAETSQVSGSGFTVTHAAVVTGEPEQVWQAFTQLPRWWKASHTWSGQSSNMTLDAQAGGCWCERWGEGPSAMHGRVLLALPGSALRLQAWLGPLQEMPVAGVLTFGTAKRDGQTRLRVTYRVAGGADAGLDKLAAPVDEVIGEQFKRLKLFIETGRPE
ncbi:MAG: SRPBCC family protein [Rubrivivax sp.]|nr:SRPBCC family protein [Rubrivivax sp.]